MILDPTNPLHLIPAALATNPEAVAVLPVFSPADPDNTLVLRARTKLRRLPPDLAAHLAQQEAAEGGSQTRIQPPTHIEVGHVLLTVPADVARNLRGPVEERHPLFIFMVRREFYNAAIRQAETGLVLPSGMGGPGASNGGGVIIKP